MPTKTKTRAIATTQEKPAAAPVHPTLERKPFLSGAAERITEAVADILLHGSIPLNLQRLIEATISHEYRMRWQRSYKSEEELQNAIIGAQRQQMPEMLAELADLRSARINIKDDGRPKPSDVIGRIRETARRQCARELQSFLDDGTPEELRLMWTVLENRGGATQGKAGYGGLPLATAFQEELDYGSEYFRVPRSLVPEVDAYITSLLRIYGKPEREEAAQ